MSARVPASPSPATVPVASFWGDDLFGLERAAAEFGEHACGGPFERWRVRGEDATVEVIAERVATSPLFGGGTLVVVVEPAPLLRARAGREAIATLIGDVAPGNGLVFLESVDGSGRRAAGGEALREAVDAAGGETRELKAPRQGELAAWIDARARERSVTLGRGAAQALAERVGGFVREGDIDRRRQGQLAVAELDKLALYRPGAEVSADDVRELVPEAVPGSAWALLDAIAERRARQAAGMLDHLLDTTPEPVLVAQLHRRLRDLLEVADRLSAGETPGSLVRSMRLNPYRAKRLAGQASAWTRDELERALDGLLELDVAVKGADGRVTTDAQRRASFVLWVVDRVGGT